MHDTYQAFKADIVGFAPEAIPAIGRGFGVLVPEAWNFVVRTGRDSPNEWKEESIDLWRCLCSAYPNKFGAEDGDVRAEKFRTPMIYGISVMSNSQRTSGRSAGCFGALRLAKRDNSSDGAAR
jgi:hypothetical protein